jgi:hypothetical protein
MIDGTSDQMKAKMLCSSSSRDVESSPANTLSCFFEFYMVIPFPACALARCWGGLISLLVVGMQHLKNESSGRLFRMSVKDSFHKPIMYILFNGNLRTSLQSLCEYVSCKAILRVKLG